MQVRKQQLELDMEQTSSKLVCQGCILSPLLNLYAENIMRNAGLEEKQAGIKIARKNINNIRYANDTTLMAESEEELKSLLMKVKVESEKVGLKLNIQKMKIMASGPIAIAATAKLLQLCPTLCDPIDSSPLGSSVPGILQARTLEWGAIAFSRQTFVVKVISLLFNILSRLVITFLPRSKHLLIT